MRKIIFVFVFLFAASLHAETLKFGVSPANPNTQESLKLFMKFLSQRTGHDIELITIDFNELLPKLSAGEIAFADLTSSAYAEALSQYGGKIKYVATVAARNEKGELKPYYKGLFFVQKDAPYKSLLELKGKSFGFVNKISTSGYVYPLATLHSVGIEPEPFFGSITFTGTHERVFEGLKNGFLDAGVSNLEAWEKAKVLYGDIFNKIAETAEIPSGAIVASAKTSDVDIEKVEDALLSIKPQDPVVNYPGFFYKGFIVENRSFYDTVKKLFKRSAEIPIDPYP